MRPSMPGGSGPGTLVAIGGAEGEGNTSEPVILGRFVYASGGRSAELVVIPVASSQADTGARYEAVLRRLGARAVRVLAPRTRKAADSQDLADRVRGATGIFFTGGDQFRLSKRLHETALGDAIRSAWEGGAAVGGTSAGAAFLSERMIAFGKSGATPRPGMVTLAPGLGLTSRFVIDQHFRQRDRLGRLLTALISLPDAMGLGLDENTAAVIRGDTLEVVGNGAVTLVDPGKMQARVPHHADPHDPICMTDLRLHILVHGATFDIRRRVAAPPCAAREEPALP